MRSIDEMSEMNSTNTTDALEDFEVFDTRDALNVGAYSTLSIGKCAVNSRKLTFTLYGY